MEAHHRTDLVAGGFDKTWSLEDLRRSRVGADEAPAKRTVERWISTIPWLESSHQLNDQVDELSRAATQQVLNALVTGARKKRKAALFVQLHDLPIENDDQKISEYKVLVAEDGKGAKRWCLLRNDEVSSLVTGLTRLAAGKPTVFFPVRTARRDLPKIGGSGAKSCANH